jgi:hypothetical protein
VTPGVVVRGLAEPGLDAPEPGEGGGGLSKPELEPRTGDAEFNGCSGSPIIDFERRLVAIVTGGDESSNTVRGVAIQRVLPILEIVDANVGA